MAKRLNSEIRLKQNGFKVKVGTTNRLNPSTVYIDIGGFIIPQTEKDEYDYDVKTLEKEIHRTLKNKLKQNAIFDNKYICVIEIPHERMKIHKPSYLFCQCHLKQKTKLTVDDVLKETQDFSENIVNDLKSIVENNDFLIKN